MTVSKEAPKIDLNFDTGEDTFKLLGDPVNRDSLNFSFDTSAVTSSSTPAISPTTTITAIANNNNTADLARLESPAIKSNGRRSTFDPVAIAEHQLQLQNEQEQQLKHNNDANKIQLEEDVRGQNSQPEVEPHTKNQQQQQQDELQQVVSATATCSAVIEESSLPVNGNQTSQHDAPTADAAVSDGSPAHTIDAEAAAPEQTKTATTTSATTGNKSANADAVVDNTKTSLPGEINTSAATTTTTTVTTATTTTTAAAVIEKKLLSEQKVVSNEPAKQPAMSAEKPNTAAAKQTTEQETKTCFCF